jgi:serine/threonine protein kinase
MGCGKQTSVVYLIDFGLSKEFRNPNTHRHILYRDALGFAGTAVFASINSHRGWELGRRDDLESLAYLLIYFLRGSLPWQGLGHLDGSGRDAVAEDKQQISSDVLCDGLPVAFGSFLDYSRSLSFDAKPNYPYLFDLFDNLLSQEGLDGPHADLLFDWDVVEDGQLGGSNLPHLPSRRRLVGVKFNAQLNAI